jgi:predicted dehydrogenase
MVQRGRSRAQVSRLLCPDNRVPISAATTTRSVVPVDHQHLQAQAHSVHIREAVAGGTGFLWEINGTDGTLRNTADAAFPEIYPLTVAGAHGRNEPAELAVPAALEQKWPALTSLHGTPAFNVGRAYAAFAADIDNGSHTVPDFADAVRRHEVIAAIERSAASAQRVTA